MVEHTKVTIEQVYKVINNKSELYEAAIRNGYYLPVLKSSIITEKFLTGVIHGTVWCPQFKEIRLNPCPRPPSKEILMDKLRNYVKKEKRQLDFDEKRQPDKQWVLTILSTFTPNDEIFARSYVPPAKLKKVIEFRSVDLPNSFLKGLPPSKKKIKARRLKLFKSGVKMAKIDKLKDQLHNLEKKLIKEKEKRKEEFKSSDDEQSRVNKNTQSTQKLTQQFQQNLQQPQQQNNKHQSVTPNKNKAQ